MTLSTHMMLAAIVIPAGLGIAMGQVPDTPPPGPGLDLINERCGSCHAPTQALQMRKPRAEWATTVQAMIDRGAELTPEEQGVVVEYLATNFGPPGAPNPAGSVAKH